MYYDEDFLKICKLLGTNIKNKRETANLSIKDLSELTGIRKEYLKKIENGTAYRVLIDKHLAKIADALKVPLRSLFDF